MSLTRREAVIAAGGLAAALAGCGSGGSDEQGPQARDLARRSIAIDYASFYAPIDDLKRLVRARAAQRGASVLFSSDPSGGPAQLASLRKLTGTRSGFRAVVVAPFDAAAADPIVEAAVARGTDVISFITPLASQSAAISVDASAAARLLAADARRRGIDRVTLVAPPAVSPIPDPFLPYAKAASTALRTELARAQITVGSTVTALGAADATQAVGDARAVLTWNDATALGAAKAVGRDGYVGALGAPAVTGRAALDALDGPGPLRCLVAPRLAALADALVDLPYALLHGGRETTAVVPAVRMTRGSAAARAARSDYA